MIIISIGIAGVIVVATLGESIELAIGRNLEILGRACLIKAGWRTRSVNERDGHTFNDRDLDTLRQIPPARHVTPFVRRPVHPFYCSGRKIVGRLIGVDSDFFDSLDLRLACGRRISDADVATKEPVCVIGTTIWTELFPGADAVLGRTIRTEGLAVKIVGVIGGIEDRSLARTVILPISVALTQLSGVTGIDGFYVRAGHWDDVAQLKAQVSNVLHQNQSRYKEYIEVEHFPNKIETIKKSVFLVKSLLVTALATTLFLGGLGIASAMHAAVQERTKDIGLRKAVGATTRAILLLFLAEAVYVSLSGALVGVVVGVLGVQALKRPLQAAPGYEMLILSIVGGLLFGLILGAAAGLVPAKRAGDLDSAQAMRFE